MLGQNPPRKAPEVGTTRSETLSAAASYFIGHTLPAWVEAGWEVVCTAGDRPGTTTYTSTYRGPAARAANITKES